MRIRATENPSAILPTILSILSVFLAYFTWLYVQKPSRNMNFMSRKILFVYSLVCLATFAVFGSALPKLGEIFLYKSSIIEQNKVSKLSNVYVWAAKTNYAKWSSAVKHIKS